MCNLATFCPFTVLGDHHLYLVPKHFYDLNRNPIPFIFIFWPHLAACGIFVPQLGVEPAPLAVKTQSPNHWTSREFPETPYPLSSHTSFLHPPAFPCNLPALAPSFWTIMKSYHSSTKCIFHFPTTLYTLSQRSHLRLHLSYDSQQPLQTMLWSRFDSNRPCHTLKGLLGQDKFRYLFLGVA